MRASAMTSNNALNTGNGPRSSSENNKGTRGGVSTHNAIVGAQNSSKTGQVARHHSGSKFAQNYTQQLKKQVQNSSQAHHVDPVAAKQYLQNYLSDPQNPNQDQPNTSTNTLHHHTTKNGPYNQHAQTQPIQLSSSQGGVNSQNIGAQNQTNLRSNYASHGALSGSNHPANKQSFDQLGDGGRTGHQQRTQGSRNSQLEQKSYSHTQKLVLSHKSKDALLNPTSKRASDHDHARQRAPSGSSDRHRVSDRTKDDQQRASSSNQMKRSVSAQNNTLAEANPAAGGVDPSSGLNRTYIRPSSKQRQAQHLNHGLGGGTYNPQTGGNLGRGHSPQTHHSSKTAAQMGGPNASHSNQQQIQGTSLKSYLDNQLGHLNPNQVVAAQSQKNLPRKKRIASDNQSNPNNNSHNHQANVLQSAGRNATGGKEDGGLSRNVPQSRNTSNSNKLGQGGSLPPMHAASLQVLKTQPSQPFNASATMVKGQSPQRTLNYHQNANNVSDKHAAQQQSYLSVGGGQVSTSAGTHIPTKPRPSAPNANQNQHHNQAAHPTDQNTQIRPQNPPQIPQAFQQGDLFLNVDSSYNNLLMQMIQPNKDQFDFDGTIQYVMNASELSNQALAKLLYSRKVVQPASKVAQISIPQTLAEQKAPKSRNATDQGLAKGGMAGQSKVSFFNTKKQFKAETLTAASSDEEPVQQSGVEVRRDEYGQKITQNSNQSFYAGLRQELSQCADENIKQLMPDYQQAKYSAKRNGIVAAYGANTNQGIVRNYNEDRVAIILNIMKPKSKQFSGEEWPKCSFFGIYDGHGGNVCADFLRDYLHQFIIKDKHFPKEPIKAIKRGFKEAEKLFLEFAEGQQFEVGDIDRSGSCAIIALIIDDVCYIGNTGDSRAVMSADGGKQVIGLSNDHKPTDDIEMERILGNNGRIYQNASIVRASNQVQNNLKSQIVLGPHRVFPGRLSVCRTFGDIEAKLGKLDGNPRVVIADPDVTSFRIDRNRHDFIMIGCDGIYDKLENRDCVHLMWQSLWQEPTLQDSNSLCNSTDEEVPGQLSSKQQVKTQDERRHKIAGLAVDAILKVSAVRRSCDNITAVVIAFDNFYRKIDDMRNRRSEGPPDFKVLEEIEFLPVSDDVDKHEDPKVIYIENEDILESVNEQSDQTPTNTNNKPNQNKQSSDGVSGQAAASSVLFDSTGDHSFPKNKQLDQQNQNADYGGSSVGTTSGGQGAQNNPYMNPQGGVRQLGGGEKILSEIAEEDSVSIGSGRPSRMNKQSQAATPITEPISNSFLGSVRVSQNMNKGGVGAVAASNRPSDNAQNTYQLSSGNNKSGQNGGMMVGKVTQGGNKDEPTLSKNNATIQSNSTINPIHPISGHKQQSDTNGSSTVIQQAHQRRPPSQQQRSGGSSHQSQSRRPASSSKRKSSSEGPNQQSRGQQPHAANNAPSTMHYAHTAYGYAQQNHPSSSQTAPASSGPLSHQTSAHVTQIDNHSNAIRLQQRGGVGGGQVGLAQAGHQSMGQLQRSDHHQVTAGDMIGVSGGTQSSHAIQVVGQNQSSGSLYHPQITTTQKKRRTSNTGSNQQHSQQQQQRSGSNPVQQQHKLNQNSGVSSSSSGALLGQSQSQNQNQNLNNNQSNNNNHYVAHNNLANASQIHQTRSHSNKSETSFPKKAKTQQPGKLAEIFRQVEGNNNGHHNLQNTVVISNSALQGASSNSSNKQVVNLNQTSALSNLQTGLPQSGTHHFVPKGSLTSNSQLRSLGVPAQMMHHSQIASGTTQVQNIQIKPISANKRKGQAVSTFSHSSAHLHKQHQNSHPASQTGQISISNILNSRQLKEKQLNQTTQLNSSTNTTTHHDNHPISNLSNSNAAHPQQSNTNSQNQLISQYLAQVNNNQTSAAAQHQPSNNNLAAYQSKSTRMGAAGQSDKQSPGVLSRAQRVQMSFNTGMSHSSKTLQPPQNTSHQTLTNAQIMHRQNNTYANASANGTTKSTTYQGSGKGSQAHLPSSQTKTEKSRNGGGLLVGTGQGSSQGASGVIPKWQSLTAQQQQLRDSGSLSGPGLQGAGVFTQKKRKSNH